MHSLTHNTVGVIHLFSSLASVLLGTLVLISKKGTRSHKLSGYSYVFSMLVLNGTALSIYHLFGTWGPFHYAALLSLATLMMGFLPAFFRVKNWMQWHVAGMYYSVIGLYAALVSEVVTRIPGLPFFWMVFAGTGLVMIIGVVNFGKYRRAWMRQLK